MSFNGKKEGIIRADGWFLDHEECVRKTYEATQAMATTADDGTKYVPMGTPYPSNDNKCIGLIYEDVDVTTGNMPCSVVLKGVVIEDRLPVALDSDAKSALVSAGFTFVEETTVTRP